MQHIISATFDSVDEAERAISRLRHSVAAYSVSVEGENLSSLPADAPFTANVYYPYRPINLPTNVLNTMPYEIGGRVLLTSEIMGLPVYPQGTADIQLTLPNEQVYRARAIIINAGGRNITVH